MADETLLDGLKKKRRNSIERAIEIYTPYISTVVFNLAGNSLSREDTEEIISDVFISLWENAAYINLQKGTIRSYIAAIARNATLKRLRQKKEFYTCDNFEAVDQDNEFERFEEYEILWKSVMSLGEPDNEIFVRYYKYGEKLNTISKATGLNLSTIKSKLKRGKRKLKNILLDSEVSK